MSDSFSPKKSLGQNFLTDKKALEKILEAADLSQEDNIIEIGPGKGVLTEKLVKKVGRVIAIEKDENLAEYLDSRIMNQKSWRNTKLIRGDILEVNLPKLVEENDFFQYKLVANIPYYITGQILRLFLETRYKPKMMVLLVQKEVAQRVCAKPGQMSILAVSVQYYGQPEIVGIVPKTSFYPVPEVDSAILKISLNLESKSPIGDLDSAESTRKFFRIVKIGFSNKRKTLVNNLAVGFKKNKMEIEEVFKNMNLDKNIRAQELSLDNWKILQNYL